MPFAALVVRPILEVGHEASELLDRFLVGSPAFFGWPARLHPGRPSRSSYWSRDQRRRSVPEQVDPIEWTLLSLKPICRS